MTDREKANYRELLQRATFIVGQCHLLLSDCEDGDREKIPGTDETTVRHNISHAVCALCQWTGCLHGNATPAESSPKWEWTRFIHDDHPVVVLPVRTVNQASTDPDIANYREAYWDGHWIDLSHMARQGWAEAGPGIAIPE